MGRRIAAVVVAGLVASTVGSGSAGAFQAAGSGTGGTGGGERTASAGGDVGGERHTVTLITGDVVTVATSAGARPTTTASVVAAPRPGGVPVAFRQMHDGERLFVVPSDAAALVSSGVLDRRLFDVTGLVEAGLTGEQDTRLIVQMTGESIATGDDSLMRGVARDAGLDVVRSLTSIDAVATAVTGEEGLNLVGALGASPGSSPAAVSRIQRVWLDAPVRSMDAESMPQIGAPQAWDAGFTGEGVTVAVLDTGIDTTHPDLAGQVILEGNFSDSPDTMDRAGHGTHVAGIIAGTGAVDPAMRGVAYDASLINTKVLDDDGYGWESEIIAGMEWSAQQGADILNMSLGVPFGFTDGTDPGAQAVNAISEEYDVLIAVAAGNEGWAGPGSVATPGTADLGLTVGAVDKSDVWAEFSGQGPRTGDSALKPDIVAPGVDIIAARAADGWLGDPIDEHYTSMSGTSMATPHVAGAAAVLAQAQPDLSGQELKSVLMGSAQPVGDTVWREGAGRVYLPTTLDAQLVAQPASLSFGLFPFPQDELQPETRTLTYRNDGDTDVTVALTTELADDAGDHGGSALTLSAQTLAVPAGGTATVDVTITPGQVDVGRWGGVVLASDDEGRQVRTTVGFENEPLKYDLTIRAIDRSGGPAQVDAAVLNVQDASIFADIDVPVDGETTIRVEPGPYSVTAYLPEWDESGDWPEVVSLTGIYQPQLEVAGDTVVELDAREATPLTVRTEQPATTLEASLTHQRTDYADNGGLSVGWGVGDIPLYATPTEPVLDGTFAHLSTHGLEGPGERPDYTYDLAFVEPVVPADLTYVVSDSELAAIDSTYRAETDPSLFLEGRGPLPDGWWMASIGLFEQEGPTQRTEFVSTEGVQWVQSVMEPDDEGWPLTWWDTDFESYEPGQRLSTAWLSAVYSHGLPGIHGVREADLVEFVLPHVADDHGHATMVEGAASSYLGLWAGGELIAESEEWPDLMAEVPTQADLRLVQRTQIDHPQFPRSIHLDTEWTFPSATTEDLQTLPMLDIRYGVQQLSLLNESARQVRMDAEVYPMPTLDGPAPAPELTAFETWWSADDGDTWTEAEVTLHGQGNVSVAFDAPSDAEFVSLRATATDAAGSTVTEEVIRAFRVDGELDGPEVVRVAGLDRYATAAQISAHYEPGVDTVVVATGLEFADALVGAARAGELAGPVLLTRPHGLASATRSELSRLEPSTVLVLGGTEAIHDAVMDQIRGVVPAAEVRRIGGTDRYQTAALVAREFGIPETIYVTTGVNFPDALAASALPFGGSVGPAAYESASVLLTRPTSLPGATRAELERISPERIVVVGGVEAVSDEVMRELEAYGHVDRVAGDDRYHTAVLLAEEFTSADMVVLASGQNWPDALAGAAWAKREAAPLLLVRQDNVPGVTWGKLEQLDPSTINVLGGPVAVSEEVLHHLRTLR
ncbi:S8 family serine peptidase [Ornithinimicrobium pratense]|uniref:S8 family serine peptidase n=1 Tax=Ornithinimicrobium pratense TaxID=2593973 RepID=A0A5J6V4Z6_9MICO|nr:S8 family serine peptidase [Ornithinimicrobium pratense]QFG68201.1 S8 family serine peptidase [Ornithinimicrobium pratense]